MKKIFFIIFASMFVLGACKPLTSMDGDRGVNDSTPKTDASFHIMKKLNELSFKNYNGNTVRFSDFDGPLVINSWAAWCPFCREELPAFAEVQKEFEGQVTFIAIDRREDLEISKKYTDELGVTDDMIFLLDPDDSFYRSIGGFAMPETLFVNADGIIVEHKRGPLDAEQTREKVMKLLR